MNAPLSVSQSVSQLIKIPFSKKQLTEFLWNFIQAFGLLRIKKWYSQETFLFLGKSLKYFLKSRLFGVGKKFVPLMQGLPNSCMWWEEVNCGWGLRESAVLLGGDFFTGWREPEYEGFWQFEPFSKLKATFCEYWTSVKIKINMTCVSKEYAIKAMEQEQCLELKMLLLLGYNLKIVF